MSFHILKLLHDSLYQSLLFIINMDRCDHFILLSLYNIFIFMQFHYLFVIGFIKIF